MFIDIKEKVYDIIVDKLAVPRESLKEESNLSKELGADSLDSVELIMEFEKVFKISIPDEDVDKLTTVGAIVEYIKKNTEGENSEEEGGCCHQGCGSCSDGGCCSDE